MEKYQIAVDSKLIGQKEFLIMNPDGYLLRFVQNLVERDLIYL